MTPMLILAASLAAALVAWYACGPIAHAGLRAGARAFFIALLCSPVLIVGHGFAVVPSLFGLAVQPSVFTLGPILVVWILVSGLVMGLAPLRGHRNRWPPPAAQLFLQAPRTKLLLFGAIVAVLLITLLYADDSGSFAVVSGQYLLVFAGAAVNLLLCYRLVQRNDARLLVTPVFFALPGLAATVPIVALIWYGGGVLGTLIGSGRARSAMWLSTAIFAFLAINSLLRAYDASNAPAHVSIQGGVTGNAALAVVFAGIGVAAWYTLSRLAAPPRD